MVAPDTSGAIGVGRTVIITASDALQLFVVPVTIYSVVKEGVTSTDAPVALTGVHV